MNQIGKALNKGRKFLGGVSVFGAGPFPMGCDGRKLREHACSRVRHFWVTSHAILVLSAALVVQFFACNKAFGNTNENAFTKSRFYQFLTDPNPSVHKVVFEREMFSDEIPIDGRKQVFSLSKTADDYLLSVQAGTNDSAVRFAIGSYKGSAWGFMGQTSELAVSDPAINKGLTPISAQESATRMTVNLLLNLGITELVRGSLVWDQKNSHFIGQSTSDGVVIITFDLADNLPTRAKILHESGVSLAYVDYEYSSAIWNGELPFRFSRHIGSPEKELRYALRVDVLEAEFANVKDAETVTDPASMFHPRTKAFYSNNVVYTIEPSGKATKALTIAEYQASMSSIEGTKNSSARVLVIAVMVLGLGTFANFLYQTNKKNKQK